MFRLFQKVMFLIENPKLSVCNDADNLDMPTFALLAVSEFPR